MSVSSKAIGKAIEKKHGLKDIGACSKGGCVKFYCDENEDLGLLINELDAEMICYLNHLTVNQWVERFEQNIEFCYKNMNIEFTLVDLKQKFGTK